MQAMGTVQGIEPLPHPILIRSFSFVLFLLYAVITLIAGFQIGRIIFYRHNLLHFQFLFLVYCFVWGMLRSVFWLLIPWTAPQELCLQGLGLQVQFWTFTLVILFFFQMIHKIEKTWKDVRVLAMSLYLLVNTIFLSGFIAYAVLTFIVPSSENATWVDNSFAYFTAIMYFFLAVVLAYYGWRLLYLVVTTDVQIPFLKSRTRVTVLSILLVLIFSSRSVRDCLAGAGVGVISVSSPFALPLATQIAVFLMMFIWELIPAVVVISFFWHIPHTEDNTSALLFQPPVNIQSETSSLVSAFALGSQVETTDSLGPKSAPEHWTPPQWGGTPVKKQPVPPFKGGFTRYNTASPLNRTPSQEGPGGAV